MNAISSGSVMRCPRVTLEAMLRNFSSDAGNCDTDLLYCGVMTSAGTTAFTRIPNADSECAHAWAPCTSPKRYDLAGRPTGSYTFSVRASDRAGNVGPAANSPES